MLTRINANASILLVVIALLLGACASNGDLVASGETISLPLLPGEVSLKVADSGLPALQFPSNEQMFSGKILMFSPLEFRSQKDRFNYEATALPLGRYVAVRHSGEGISAGLSSQQARSFSLRYDARYPDMAAARRNFPGLNPTQYRKQSQDGKSFIEITQWQLRLSMIFSRKHNAFRVLLDDLEYHAPKSEPSSSEDGYKPAQVESLPVVVAFAYQHPDAKHEVLVQQNVFFEFLVKNRSDGFRPTPQISGWIPLAADSGSMPYTVGVVVAEVHETREDFYKKLFNLVRNVRGFI